MSFIISIGNMYKVKMTLKRSDEVTLQKKYYLQKIITFYF